MAQSIIHSPELIKLRSKSIRRAPRDLFPSAFNPRERADYFIYCGGDGRVPVFIDRRASIHFELSLAELKIVKFLGCDSVTEHPEDRARARGR